MNFRAKKIELKVSFRQHLCVQTRKYTFMQLFHTYLLDLYQYIPRNETFLGDFTTHIYEAVRNKINA